MFNLADSAALCGLIAGYDNRFVNDKATRGAWLRAAERNGWTLDDAIEAVERFYNRPRQADDNLPRIVPGHIDMLIRQMTPGGTGPAPAREVLAKMREPLPETVTGPPASPELRARLHAQVTFELEAKRGRPSKVPARRPIRALPARKALEARRPEGVDVEAEREQARRQLRALTARSSDGPVKAFGG